MGSRIFLCRVVTELPGSYSQTFDVHQLYSYREELVRRSGTRKEYVTIQSNVNNRMNRGRESLDPVTKRITLL